MSKLANSRENKVLVKSSELTVLCKRRTESKEFKLQESAVAFFYLHSLPCNPVQVIVSLLPYDSIS